MTNETQSREVAERDQRREELASVEFSRNGQMFQPRNGRELMDMANLMSGAGLMVKDIYRKNPGACMGLIAVCAPYGMNPLQVSWKTYQTKPDAPIAYESQVVVAMVNASGAVKGSLKYRYEGEGQSRRCCCFGTLKGDTEAVEVWSPPLGMINPKNSPLWKTDPDQQLAYYSGRSWARRYKPEMLLGIYDVDEMEPVRTGPDAARDVTPRQAPRPGRAMYIDPDPVVDEIHEAEPESLSLAAPERAMFEDLARTIIADAGETSPVEVRSMYADQIELMKSHFPDLHEAVEGAIMGETK